MGDLVSLLRYTLPTKHTNSAADDPPGYRNRILEARASPHTKRGKNLIPATRLGALLTSTNRGDKAIQ